METLWFIIIGAMLTIYVLLDGFDFGSGIIYLFIAKTDAERRAVLNAIGPVWDGNEVWLIAGGGTLFFAFPAVYAASFSGFYLALIMVLWLLMLRGISMEFRSQISNGLWKSFWDAVLAFASIIIAVVLGAALGNVIRGVPLNAEGYFFVPFWTNFGTGTNPGILDWYTITVGLFSLFLLAVHGANYIAMKTEGELQERARNISKKLVWAVAGFAIIFPFLTSIAQPEMLMNFNEHPAGYLLPVFTFAALFAILYFRYRNKDTATFLSTSAFIAGLLLTAVFTIFPNILIATTNPSYSLTVYNSAASPYGLQVGIIWFVIGISLASAYTIFMYRSFRGKVKLSADEDGY